MDTYTAMVFFGESYYEKKGDSAEDCLKKLEQSFGHCNKFTYRPKDGTIYCDHNHIPCGVIFKVGYSDTHVKEE